LIFTLDGITIELIQENRDVRLTAKDNIVLLPNQTIDSTKSIVIDNFHIVKSYYESQAGNAVDKDDLSIISLKIVLYYLSMYNLWRRMYKDQRNRDLKFLSKDFENSSTHDEIIWYFKNKYPDNYSDKCRRLLGMSMEEFKKYEKRRQEFINMW
jgi:hypothetical protein